MAESNTQHAGQRVALILGITGQDGSYLTELLLDKGYVVHGIVRRSSSTARPRLDHLFGNTSIYGQRLFLHYAELDDTTTIRRLLVKIAPDEIYHLAGQSHVGQSFEIPESTCEFTAMCTLKLLEIVRDLAKPPRIAHASSSEIFGKPTSCPQNEMTPFRPVNPYGVAKAFATDMVRVYRDAYRIFGCNAICYNHESPRRGESFVTRKITKAAARIKLGYQRELSLGDLSAKRDWGYAPDYADAMWRMLQHHSPNDYIVATGVLHSVEQFLEYAFRAVDLDWRSHVKIDPKFLRPIETTNLCGDSSRIRNELGWQPTLNLQQIAETMVKFDLKMEESLRSKKVDMQSI